MVLWGAEDIFIPAISFTLGDEEYDRISGSSTIMLPIMLRSRLASGVKLCAPERGERA